jgi:hypothetical protein
VSKRASSPDPDDGHNSRNSRLYQVRLSDTNGFSHVFDVLLNNAATSRDDRYRDTSPRHAARGTMGAPARSARG